MTSPSPIPSMQKIMLRAVALPLGLLLLYVSYHGANQWGLALQTTSGVVEDKQHFEGGTNYSTRIVAGRAWVQSVDNGDICSITVKTSLGQLASYVSGEKFQALQIGDPVTLTYHQTRLTGRIEVVDITKQ